MRINRKDFVSKKSLCLCFVYFDDSCFEYKSVILKDVIGEVIELKKWLIKGFVLIRIDVVFYIFFLIDRKRRRVSEVVYFIVRGIVLFLVYVTYLRKFTNKFIFFRKLF